MTKAQLARANLPARTWIQWFPFPVRPWRVQSNQGYLMASDTAGGCERWLKRYGYTELIDPVNETGPVYVKEAVAQ